MGILGTYCWQAQPPSSLGTALGDPLLPGRVCLFRGPVHRWGLGCAVFLAADTGHDALRSCRHGDEGVPGEVGVQRTVELGVPGRPQRLVGSAGVGATGEPEDVGGAR